MRRVLLLLFMALALFSCKKKNCEKSMDDIAGTYRLTAFALESDPFNRSFGFCERNTDYILNSDGRVTVRLPDGCPGADPTGTWGVLNGTKLYIRTGTNYYDVNDATIVSFDCSRLELDDPQHTATPRKRFIFEKK